MEKRELKYIAWDKDMREMVSVSGIQFVPHSPKEKPCIIDQYNDIRDLEDVILMQYTTLKDILGKEIYEDYILEFGGTYIGDHYEKSGIGKVVFDDGCYMCTSLNHTFELTSISISNRQIKIKGNVHENPELLK